MMPMAVNPLVSACPILEQQQSTPFIPNDIVLNAEHPFMLITGPNMAGEVGCNETSCVDGNYGRLAALLPARLARLYY